MGRKSKPDARRKADFNHKRTNGGEKPDSTDGTVVSGTKSHELALCGATFAVLMALYVRTLYPSIPGGDSGELIVSAHEFGVAHPPGYPLFTLGAQLVMYTLPWGSVTWRVGLMNAALAAAAGATLQMALLRLTGCHGSSLLAVALFSLSRLAWTWSVTAEVFALNNLLIAAILFLAVTFDQAQSEQKQLKVASIGAFVGGLSLCNQHTAAVYVGSIATWVLVTLGKQKVLSLGVLLRLGGCFLMGLLPYLYLPVSSLLGVARWTWGDHTSLMGFVTHLLRREYGTFDLGKDSKGVGFVAAVGAYTSHVWEEYHTPGLVLATLGTFLILARKSVGCAASLFVFLLMLVAYVLFFAWRANLDINNPLFMGVVERFWMQSDIVVAVLVALGYHEVLRWLREVVPSSGITVLGMTGAGLVALYHIQENYTACDQSGNRVVADFAQSLLKSMPPNALVLNKGDLPTNTMRYFHLCEGVRPDLQLLDVEILTYQWSLPMLRKSYPRVTFPGDYWHLSNTKWPDGRTSFNFKAFLDANYKKSAIFVCIGMQERDPSWKEGYQLWPHGVCHQVAKLGQPMNPQQWGESSGSLADSWKHPVDGFDVRSWEKVANDEMWHAKISSAFFMYQQGEAASDAQMKASCLLVSYQLYKGAIQKHQGGEYPVFWHKNFGLVCERLLYVEHSFSKADLCEESIKHFVFYVERAADDPDLPHVEKAIAQLQERVPAMRQLEAVEKSGIVT